MDKKTIAERLDAVIAVADGPTEELAKIVKALVLGDEPAATTSALPAPTLGQS